MSYVIYVYGTLRPGGEDTVQVPGQLFNLGWYPGAKLGGESTFTCERVEVDSLDRFDLFESYDENNHSRSLYIRRPYEDGWIYEYNFRTSLDNLIESGDWLEHTGQKKGARSDLLLPA